MHRFMGLLLFLTATWVTTAQTTVFSEDFTTSQGTQYTTANGSIGASPTWSFLRSGTDFGGGINVGILSLINDATGAFNQSGWGLNYTSAAAFAAPYSTILANNPGPVTWTFNMRQVRSNPSGLASGLYGAAFVIAGTSNTTATTGSGYAVVLGNSGTTDPLRLVRYTAGLRTSTNIISSNTSGLSDFGAQYLSVRVVYTPATNTWQLFVRNDGTTTFQDPATGTLILQGSVVNTGSVASNLSLLGAYWNAGTVSAQRATFDNVKVTVALPVLTSISPTSRVAGTGAFTLTVNGSNFVNTSTVRWNGVNLTTTYVSPTQLTAAVPAANIAAAGTAAITVATGTGVSNALNFVIDTAGVPSVAASVNALQPFTTITGTASAAQSFTTTGSNLTGNITVTAPANFEVALASGGPYTTSVTATAASTPIFTRVRATTPAGLYTNTVSVTTPGGEAKQVAVTATVFATEPTTSATLVTFSNTTSIGTNISWTNGNGTNRLVVVRAGSAVNSTPVDGTTYTASTAFGSGSEIGTGNYVVYSGTSNTVTVTGLLPATTYHVAVYEFNGTAGTQNYKITTPATGNRTTLNAPVGLQVAAANTQYRIDFDGTVEGVNNGVYNGGAINATPDPGELNSNSWAFTGFSDGAIAFGGTSPEESASYENGVSEGGVTDGGLYAFEVAPDNVALGIQPAPGEFAPGSVTLRFQNQTGAPITSLNIGYKVYVYNDEAGETSFNFSHSANNSTYTTAPVLDQSTTAAPDGIPGWKAYYKVITLTGLNITASNYYYLRWTGTGISGTVYDELALDDVAIIANPSTVYAAFDGTAETFTLAGNANLDGLTTINSNITFNNGKVLMGSDTLTISGSVTNTTLGGIRGSAVSNLVVSGIASPTLSFDTTTPGTTNLLNSLSINTIENSTVTVNSNVLVNGTLTVDEGQTLNLGTSTLTGTLTTINNNGTVTTQNTGATPFAANKTWAGTGTVVLNAATAPQTLVASTYNNVTVTTTGGATAGGDITVNGNLNLPNANPSATLGSFSTGAFILFMGPSGYNSGLGDVSGITTRTSIQPNTVYTFGHQRTTILFPPVGTLPVSASIKTILGSAPVNKPDGILRTYDFIQNGGTGTKATISAHYLDSELNGNTENRLVDWVVQISPLLVIEQGRTSFNVTENYVELANVNVAFFTDEFGEKLLTLAGSQVATSVWNGSVSTSWTTAANWTPNATPSDETNVIIPNAATTPNDPVLNPSVTINKITIETGGILNAPDNSQFTLNGASGTWINNGTYNPGSGTSNVTFTAASATTGDATIAGNTTFNNITVPSGTLLRVATDNVMSIAGTFTKAGILIAGAVNNTIAYTGTNQTIVVPNGADSAYYNLTINGTGAVLPASLTVNGNITTNSPVDFSGKTISLLGLENQTIGGTVAPQFNNFIVNKPSGIVILSNDAAVTGTLTLTSGRLNIGNYDLTLGANPVAGSFSTTNMIVAQDSGLVRAPYAATGSYFFPIGELTSNASYSPITVDVTNATAFNNGYVGVSVVDAVHPNNNSAPGYFTRYWNVVQTGIENAIATITGTYILGDAVGGEAGLSAAQLNGTFDVVTNPWVKFSPLGGTTLTATNALLTEGQTSVFSAITATNLVALITGEGTFCEGEQVTLTAQVNGGDAPFTYEWSNGLGNATTAIPSTTTPGTVTYTLTVRDVNGIASTDTADVIVTEGADPGILTGDQVVCANTAPQPITLTGYTGTIVRWERSLTPAFTSPIFIASTSATLTGQEIGTNLTATRYVRAVIQNGSCPVVFSNPVAITINTTTWNGTTWSNGIPADGVTAVFTSNYTAATDLVACTIIVNNNANVVIPTGFNAIVSGAVTVNSGTFMVNNNASLVQLDDEAINTGNITVIKNSNPLYRLDYTMWSSPVSGQQLQAFSPITSPTRFYEYNGILDQYSVVPNALGSFEAAKGYLIRMPNTITGGPTGPYFAGTSTLVFTGIFNGIPHNGTIATELNTAGNRYTAVGNPYPSPISVADFYTQNDAVLDDDAGLYFWRKKNDISVSSYAVLTLAGFVANGAIPTGDTTPTPGYAQGGQDQAAYYTGENTDWTISQGQGFIVKAQDGVASPQLTFTNEMRRTSPSTGSQPFLRQGNVAAPSRMWLNLTGQNSFSQTAIAYIDGATMGLDYGYDGKRIANNSLAGLYTTIQGSNLAIQARPAFTDTDVVPLTYAVTTPGMFTIAIDHADGIFTTGQDIYIKDKLTGILHNVSNGAYSFATEAGTFTNRFEVVYMQQQTTAGVEDFTIADVTVYKKGKRVVIAASQDIASVVIFDIAGRRIYAESNINSEQFESDELAVAQQVLIVNATMQNGAVVSKKVMFN